MKRGLFYVIGMSAIALFLLFNSCNKINLPNHFPDPLTGGCQVAEFHGNTFDFLYPQGISYLFKKKYDPSGKTLKEIVFFFSEDQVPFELLQSQYDYQVVDKGRRVYLITQDAFGHGQSDTSAVIYLNPSGRPDSIVSYSQITYHFDARAGETVKTYFQYREQRLFTARTVKNGYFVSTDVTDTARYDHYGNAVSFADHIYQYDYTRQAKQQCYLDDYAQNRGEIYLLEYLGYFPELTSPVNLRTSLTGYEGGSITNHQLDGDGKLISYDTHMLGHVTITWNCH